MNQPAPGWYPQPDGVQRYWDGDAWASNQTTADATAGTAAGAAAEPTTLTIPAPAASADRSTGEVASGQQVVTVPQAEQAAPSSPVVARPVVAPTVAAKSPAATLLVSLFLPGVGSMTNGDIGMGVGILIGWMIAVGFSFILIGIPFLVGFEVWSIVHAYKGAQRWNARHGIIS